MDNELMITYSNAEIYWYFGLLPLGVLVGIFLLGKEANRLMASKNFVFNILLWVIPSAIIGARLYYVIFNWHLFSDNLMEILKFWDGGMEYYGAFILGFLVIITYTKIFKYDSLKVIDIFSVSLLVTIAVSKWQVFLNGNFGIIPTTIEHLRNTRLPEWFINRLSIEGIYYLPIFLYESMLFLLGFVILIIVRRYKYIKAGQLTCLSIIWYYLVKLLDPMPGVITLGELDITYLLPISIMIISLLGFIIFGSRRGHFESLYNGKGLMILAYNSKYDIKTLDGKIQNSTATPNQPKK